MTTTNYSEYTFSELCTAEIDARETYSFVLEHAVEYIDEISAKLKAIIDEKHTRPECKAETTQEAVVEEKQATTTKTPGFNCRIAIFFQSDKNGRKCAYYWSGRLGDGRAIRMKLAEAENLVAQGQVDLLPGHPLKAAMQEPEQVVVEPAIEEEKQAMTAIELYNLSNGFNNMRQSAKKRTIATMLENMACEHGYITIEGKMYHFNGDKLTRNYEESKCYWCNVVKPVLTEETITYTIVSRPTQNGIPFIARVLVPGQEVQEFDPQPGAWWMYTEGDLGMAVNKQFKGAWYLKPEVFETRVAEQQKVEDVASEMDIPTSEVATIAAIAQQAKDDKQAETKLETVPSQEIVIIDKDIHLQTYLRWNRNRYEVTCCFEVIFWSDFMEEAQQYYRDFIGKRREVFKQQEESRNSVDMNTQLC